MDKNLRIEKAQIRTMKKDLANVGKKLSETPSLQTKIEPLIPTTSFQSIKKDNPNPVVLNTEKNYTAQKPVFKTSTVSIAPQKPSPVVKDELNKEEKERIAKEAHEKFTQAKEKEKLEKALATEKAEKEKLAKEKLEKERLEKEKIEKEKLEKALATEKAEKEKLAKTLADEKAKKEAIEIQDPASEQKEEIKSLEKEKISSKPEELNEITSIADAISGRQVKEKIPKTKGDVVIAEIPSIEQLTERAEMDSFAEHAKKKIEENKKEAEIEKEKERIRLAKQAEEKLIEIKKKKEETDEEKLRRITDATFDTEEAISKLLEEKAPFEQRMNELKLEIERAQKKLDLIIERKERIEEVKKTIEGQENTSQSVDEKRAFEKERWRVEDQRNDIVLEQEEKEDELKSLAAQLGECEYNYEKISSKERELNLEIEILRRDREDILLEQQKKSIQTNLEKIEAEAFAIKDQMFENTKLKNELEKNLDLIKNKEKLSEEEIRIIEKRTAAAGTENETRLLQQQRKEAEKTRRDIETERWKIEDSLAKAEKERERLKERYQAVSGEVKAYRDKISEINQKKEQNIKIQISQISNRIKNKDDVIASKDNEDEDEEIK